MAQKYKFLYTPNVTPGSRQDSNEAFLSPLDLIWNQEFVKYLVRSGGLKIQMLFHKGFGQIMDLQLQKPDGVNEMTL